MPLHHITRVAGLDLSTHPTRQDLAVAALVVLELPSLALLYERMLNVTLSVPYEPGYLSFREVAPALQMLRELRDSEPDKAPHAVLVDGNGRLHPRECGLASHLGALSGLPTIGVAKSLQCIDGLTIKGARQLARGLSKGDSAPLVGASGTVWGAVLRTTDDPDVGAAKPIYVSVGHGFALDSATELVRRCCVHRVPEPIRQADLRSRARLRQGMPVHAAA